MTLTKDCGGWIKDSGKKKSDLPSIDFYGRSLLVFFLVRSSPASVTSSWHCSRIVSTATDFQFVGKLSFCCALLASESFTWLFLSYLIDLQDSLQFCANLIRGSLPLVLSNFQSVTQLLVPCPCPLRVVGVCRVYAFTADSTSRIFALITDLTSSLSSRLHMIDLMSFDTS